PAARRDLLEALQGIRVETIDELDRLLQKVLDADSVYTDERFVKPVTIMPEQVLALALGRLRRGERSQGSGQNGHPRRLGARARRASPAAGFGRLLEQ